MAKAQVMVVEDESLIALEIKESLESYGYSVPEVVSTGNDAISKALTGQPDLILMDIRLDGDMDGIEAASTIRENFSVPVIFLTAHSDEETLTRAKYAESFGYLIKPFEEKELNAAIEMALYKSAREKNIRRNENWLKMVFGSMNDGLIVSDIKGNVKFANEHAADILEYSQELLTGSRIPEILRLMDKKTHHDIPVPVDLPVIKGLAINSQYLLSTKKENRVNIDLTISPLKNSNGNTTGIIYHLRKLDRDKVRDHEKILREIEEPKKLQKACFPKNGLVLNGVRLNWAFSSSAFGSGDLFNFFALDDTHLGFYILDVMGAGFSAALFSSTLYNILSPDTENGGILLTSNEIVNPAEVIHRLNRRFYFDDSINPFFSILYGVIDTLSQTATIARAGYLPPVLQKKDGSVSELHIKGNAIGVFKDMEISEEKIDFNSGDRLFMFSDGMIDLLREPEELVSSEYVANMLSSAKKNDIQSIFRKVEEIIHDKTRNITPEDDIVFMSLEAQ
ncbi:MAG: SpoIIE family protein phosphatase [Spirochaetales bacterium]|nr:SpoIIE family protein phosphatase [Spirochaetales bacterium]